MKNMKIEINEQQTLDDVVRELESKGFVKCSFSVFLDSCGSFIIVTEKGAITWCNSRLVDTLWTECQLTTLAELKEMR